MKYQFKFLFVCLLFACNAQAQGIFINENIVEWSNGSVFLVTGDSVQGSIKYYYKEDVINVLEDDGSISSFSPVNVHYFVANNVVTGSRQVFRTIYWNQGLEQSDFKKPSFFEQLNQGDLTLIMRETYTPVSSNGLSSSSIVNYRSTLKDNAVEGVQSFYYVLMPDGEVKSLRRVRRDLLRLLGDKADDVKKYAKKNDLSYDNTYELITIVEYYNSLNATKGPETSVSGKLTQ